MNQVAIPQSICLDNFLHDRIIGCLKCGYMQMTVSEELNNAECHLKALETKMMETSVDITTRVMSEFQC